jgi:ABC-type amino acid transport substrate-binding protein
MRAGDTKLVADINRALASFAHDGTASKIARRYFGQTIW